MDLNKIYDFFKPESVRDSIHIIGCGSVGSALAENLVRCGIKKLTLWDADIVVPHNVTNQMYREKDVGKLKTDALEELLTEINSEVEIIKHGAWDGDLVSGYVFMCVDNIETRKAIVHRIYRSRFVKAVFDFRTLLTSAQHYAADWSDTKHKETLVDSMCFTHEEAAESTPVSACGITLGVAPTVRTIVALGVCNFLNFVKGDGLKKFIQIENFAFILDAF